MPNKLLTPDEFTKSIMEDMEKRGLLSLLKTAAKEGRLETGWGSQGQACLRITPDKEVSK